MTTSGESRIAFELLGRGAPVVWTPGGFFPRNPFSYAFAGRLSAGNKVMIWDRPNSGLSEFMITDAPSEHHLWAKVLHELCGALGLLPAVFGGGSNGSVLSLLMAHLYPADVKGLILHATPDINSQHGQELGQYRYAEPAEVAESGGMKAVLRYSEAAPRGDKKLIARWISECAEAPDTKAKILATRPAEFATTMRRWDGWFRRSRFHLANLSDDQLRCIAVPTIVGPGPGDPHPPHLAEELAGKLPKAEVVRLETLWSAEEIERHVQGGTAASHLVLFLPFYETFLRRIGH